MVLENDVHCSMISQMSEQSCHLFEINIILQHADTFSSGIPSSFRLLSLVKAFFPTHFSLSGCSLSWAPKPFFPPLQTFFPLFFVFFFPSLFGDFINRYAPSQPCHLFQLFYDVKIMIAIYQSIWWLMMCVYNLWMPLFSS